jgi:hypothetical protein
VRADPDARTVDAPPGVAVDDRDEDVSKPWRPRLWTRRHTLVTVSDTVTAL